MKKVVALTLAAVLLFCLAIPVFADESEQITADIVGYSDARVEKKDLTNVPGFAEFANATDDQKAEFAKNHAEFKISTPQELRAFGATAATFASLTIYLANDIDMDGFLYEPMGGAHAEGSTTPFRGTFDGQGYEIKNLTIEVSAAQHVALIANAQGATIKNVIIGEGCTVSGTTNRVGAIVAAVTGEGGEDITTIDNCWNKADVTSTGGSFVGGIVGYVYVTGKDAWTKDGKKATQDDVNGFVQTAKCIVKNCTNTGAITAKGTGRDVGGIIGGTQINMEITNCRNAGTITGVGTNAAKGVGGIIGRIASQATEKTSVITGCINNGTVNPGKTAAGGILGCAGFSGTTIKDCKNFGEIKASETATAVTNGIWGAEKEGNLTNVTGENNHGTVAAAEDSTLELALKADTLIVGTPAQSGNNNNNNDNNNNNSNNNDQNQGTNAGDNNQPQKTDAPATNETSGNNGEKSGCASSLSAGLALIGCLTLAGGMLLRKKK